MATLATSVTTTIIAIRRRVACCGVGAAGATAAIVTYADGVYYIASYLAREQSFRS